MANTIENDPEALNLKVFDLDFAVDPLFKKTAADFDEGGAKGLLLNHLCISKEGRVVFDATDSQSAIEQPAAESTNHGLGHLKRNFKIEPEKFSEKLNSVWGMQLCPTFSKFKFNDESTEFVMDDFQLEDYLQREDAMSLPDHDNEPMMDFYQDDCSNDVDDGGRLSFGNPMFANAQGVVINDTENPGDMHDLFAYFDKSVTRGWAGPDFWRSRANRTRS